MVVATLHAVPRTRNRLVPRRRAARESLATRDGERMMDLKHGPRRPSRCAGQRRCTSPARRCESTTFGCHGAEWCCCYSRAFE